MNHSLKQIRMIFKALGDDTRIRIIHILSHQSLNVAEICEILRHSQSNISKHLMRLRMMDIVADVRAGQMVFYETLISKNIFLQRIISMIVKELKDSKTFQKDLTRLQEVLKNRND